MTGKTPEIKSIDKNENEKSPPPLVEGEDYYLEKGRFVFTEKYHLKRGYCCGSGCRHCPYDNKK